MLVTKELRDRVKHLREPGTPLPGGSSRPAAESGGESEVASVWSTGGLALPQGGAAGNIVREEQELESLMSTPPKSESPLPYEAVEEPSMDQGRESGEMSGVCIAPEEPGVVVPIPVEVETKSPSWLKPLRLVCKFPLVPSEELMNVLDSRASSPVDVVRSFFNHRKYPSNHRNPTPTFSHNLRYGRSPNHSL
jgi:hypothetical protein